MTFGECKRRTAKLRPVRRDGRSSTEEIESARPATVYDAGPGCAAPHLHGNTPRRRRVSEQDGRRRYAGAPRRTGPTYTTNTRTPRRAPRNRAAVAAAHLSRCVCILGWGARIQVKRRLTWGACVRWSGCVSVGKPASDVCRRRCRVCVCWCGMRSKSCRTGVWVGARSCRRRSLASD